MRTPGRPWQLTALVVALVSMLTPTTVATASAPYGEDRWGPRVDLGWRLLPTGSEAQFRGLDAVSARVVWLAGSDGAVLRTTDGGRSWADVSPPGADDLLFRDVEATGAEHAVVLAIGEGEDSQIWATDDGGDSWQQSFVNDDPAAFYDCMDFFAGGRRGLAMSDPVDGRFRILATGDGGHSWHVRAPRGMPAAVPGEFGFAASGTCLVTRGKRHAWLASGGAAARVFTSHDAGRTWSVSDTPVAPGDAAGIFSLAFRDRWHGVAVGGDFSAPDAAVRASATTRDAGRTWQLSGRPGLSGYRSGASFLPRLPVVVAVGPNGSDLSADSGRHWWRFDGGSFDAVDCARWFACFASGVDGRAARLVLSH